MKKNLFLFVAVMVLITMTLTAQNDQAIPDGSFENSWTTETTYIGTTYEEFQTSLFSTLNMLVQMSADDMIIDPTAYKDPSAQDGNFALRLVSSQLVLGEVPIFIPGAMGTISRTFIEEFLDETTGGVINVTADFNAQPHAVTGFYKFHPVNGDSCAVEIGLYNYENQLCLIKSVFYDEVTEWTPFRVEIPEAYWNAASNKIRLLFVASAGYDFSNLTNCRGQVGSTMWVDNLAFEYESGITENLASDLTVNVFPNPAQNQVAFNFNEQFDGKIVIFNLQGQEVMSIEANNTIVEINTSSLPAGSYFYRLMDGKTIQNSGKLVITK